MIRELVNGERLYLSGLSSKRSFKVALRLEGFEPQELEFLALCLEENSALNEASLVGSLNPIHKGGAISTQAPHEIDLADFAINLDKLASIEKIIFAAVLIKPGLHFQPKQNGHIYIHVKHDILVRHTFCLDTNSHEKVIVLGELYRKGEDWKIVSAPGAMNGFAALLKFAGQAPDVVTNLTQTMSVHFLTLTTPPLRPPSVVPQTGKLQVGNAATASPSPAPTPAPVQRNSDLSATGQNRPEQTPPTHPQPRQQAPTQPVSAHPLTSNASARTEDSTTSQTIERKPQSASGKGRDIVFGQKRDLSEIGLDKQFWIGVGVKGPLSRQYTCCCFVLKNDDRVISQEHVVFHERAESPCGSVRLILPDEGDASDPLLAQLGSVYTFSLNLANLPGNATKLVFTISDNKSLSSIQSGYLQFSTDGGSGARILFKGMDFGKEKVIILCEIYMADNGKWRLSAIGQGFAGGTGALARQYGSASIKEVND